MVVLCTSCRHTLNDDVRQLVEQGKSVNAVKTAVGQNATVTFSFLVMQLHARGSQAFWRSQDDTATSAYLIFRLVDIYADVLTKVEAEGYNPQYCRNVLDWLSSTECYDALESEFVTLATLIREQRATHDEDWVPDEEAIASIMQTFTRTAPTLSLPQSEDTALWYGAVAVAAAVGVCAVVWALRRR